MSDVYERYAPIAARERAAMERGDTLDVVIRRLRAEELNVPAVHVVIRQIKQIPFRIAHHLVAGDSKLPKLDLDDLALLASVPAYCKAADWLAYDLHEAIADRQRFLRLVPGDWPQPAEPGVIVRCCREGFAEKRDQVKCAIAEEPRWAREIEIMRDEPDLFEIRFVRVR